MDEIAHPLEAVDIQSSGVALAHMVHVGIHDMLWRGRAFLSHGVD